MQQSIENPRFGMTVFAISTVCNTVGNYILIFGKLGLPALGITGAAIATFSSRVVEFVISLVYALRCKQMPLMPACILRPGKATFRSFVKFSTPVLLNETLWGTGTSLYTVIMGHMAGNTDLISAYTVAGNIDKMVTVAIFGVAAAAAVIVGKEVGMGGKNAYPIGQALTFVAFCTGFGVAIAEQLLFWLVLKPHVLPLFSMTAASASLCVTMMICYSISAPLHAFATTGIVGVLRGGGDVRIAMLIDVLPLWCFTLPLLVLLGLLVVFFLVGYQRGLILTLCSLLAVILSFAGGWYLATHAAEGFQARLGPEVPGFVASSLLFLAGFLVVQIVWVTLCHALNLVAKLPGLHLLNKILGGLLGLVKGIAILMVARWALCDLLQWVPADVAAESYVLPWLTPSAFFSLFGK